MTTNQLIATLFCAAVLTTGARAETFVIQADKAGHEATVTIPVGAVTQLSANFAESIVDRDAPQFEAMRLSGDVLISITGSTAPIEIKADDVVLELTPDATAGQALISRLGAAAKKLLRSTATPPGEDAAQVFVGNVVFDLQTSAGPMQIKADRVEHQLRPDEPKPDEARRRAGV
jgi:hypothetical protein